jgi:hypothetical protein
LELNNIFQLIVFVLFRVLSVRKNTAHKESSGKVSRPRVRFNGKLAGERWHSTDSGPGVAFIEEGG